METVYVLIITTVILGPDWMGGNTMDRTAVPGFEDIAACEVAAEQHIYDAQHGEPWSPNHPVHEYVRTITTTAVCHAQASEEAGDTMSGGVPVVVNE